MAFKIYINENVLYIQDTVNDIQYEGLAKNCLHKRLNQSSDLFSFTGVNKLDVYKQFDFADIQDKDGNPISNTYATAQLLSDYLDGQLGKSSAQEGAPVEGTGSFRGVMPSTTIPDSNLNDGDIVHITPTINVVNEFYFPTIVVNNTFTVNRVVIDPVVGLTPGLAFKWRKLR